MTAQLDHLTSAVAAEQTTDASAITLIQGLSDQLRAALQQPDPSAAIGQLADELDASQAALAAAVAANTPPAQPAAAQPTDQPSVDAIAPAPPSGDQTGQPSA